MTHVPPHAGPRPFKPLDPRYAERVRESFGRQGAMRLIRAELVDVGPGYCAIALLPRPGVAQQTLMVMHGKRDA